MSSGRRGERDARQAAAGSTLKPFVYALAIKDGKAPATPVFDVPTSWSGFRPRNASLEHLGLVAIRDAS
jgi:membrane carboxypeptidase/penicillin-binding protein PbpC